MSQATLRGLREITRDTIDTPPTISTMLGALHAAGRLRCKHSVVLRALGWSSWATWMTLRACDSPFARRRPAATIRSLWTWQFWRRVVHASVVTTLPDGSQLICPSWSRIASAYVSQGFHEPAIALVLLDYLRSGDLFVDVGANIGLYSIVAARRGARVMAFEPTPRCCTILARSAAYNGVAFRVSVFPVALAARDGSALFTTSRDNTDMLVDVAETLTDAERASAVLVDVRTLDSMLANGAPAAIKIDAEGADLAVLAGAEDTLRRHRPLLIVEVWRGGSEVRDWLAERGYECYRYRSAARRLVSLPRDFAGDENVIAVHRDALAAVGERLAAAPPLHLQPPRVAWQARG